MFVFFNASSIAGNINVDKERNVYARVFLSNVKTWQYYGANIISNLCIVLFQLAVAIITMEYIVHSSIGVPPMQLFAVLAIVATVAVAFGTACVAVINDSDTASMVSNLCSLIFVVLGGSFVQVEFFPEKIKIISYISPIRWAVSCVQSMQQGISFYDLRVNYIVMMAMTLVLLTIAFVVSKRKDKYFIAL